MRFTVGMVGLAAVLAQPAVAETRDLPPHEHGVGRLNIAVAGQQLAAEFFAPGADIVGFEHPAKTEADKAAIASALKTLSAPDALFALTPDAQCVLQAMDASLESEDAHDDHDEHAHDEDKHDDHDEHAHDEDKHDDHDEHALDEDKHDDHDEHAHDEDKHDDHDEHAHDEDKHDDHDEHAHDDHDDHDEDGTSHTEFVAEYLWTCGNVAALAEVQLPYFDVFPNAKELEVEAVAAGGAVAFEVEKEDAKFNLKGLQ